MQVNPLTLSFRGDDAHLEPVFRENYNKTTLFQIRFAILLGVLIYAFFGFLDTLLLPEQTSAILGIRFLLLCPYALFIAILSYFPRFQRNLQFLGSTVLIVAGIGIATIISITEPPLSFIYYTGMILVTMYTYGFSRLRFVWATATGWIIVLVYEMLELTSSPTPLNLFISNNVFLVTANFIGMATSYSIEFSTRKNFYLLKQLEKEKERVRRINENLEKNVLERTVQLMESNQQLSREIEGQLLQSQKMEAMGSLAGGIAHDFNNILSSLIGNAELALFSMAKNDPHRHSMEQIFQAAERAKELVNQILDFSRIQPENEELVDIAPILKDTLKLLKSSIPPNIQVNSTIGSHLKKVKANPSRLHQVILNICTNAAHAMEKKGGLLHVELTNKELVTSDLSSPVELSPGCYVRLAVEDTGHGMDETTKRRIFDPFFTTKKRGKGTGLGLSIVHGIVKSLGGAITVESEPGKGSSFQVFFPAAAEEASPQKKKRESAPPKGNQEHILFIDNEKDIVDLVLKILPKLGYTVEGETNPIRGLEKFRANPQGFDLVITDMTMPEISGEELAIKIMKIRPDIPILISTGYSNTLTHERMRELGIRGLLHKPVTIQNYAVAIQAALKKDNLRFTRDTK